MKKPLIISLVLALSISSVSCSSKNKEVLQKGQINVEEETKEEKYVPDEAALYRDKREGQKIVIKEVNSWYFNNLLSEREQITYSEIKNALIEHSEEVVFSKSVNVEEFNRIMNLIYLDTPEAFLLKYQYTYETDENKNVKKLKLSYIKSKEEAKKNEDYINMEKNDLIKKSRDHEIVDVLNQMYFTELRQIQLPKASNYYKHVKGDIKELPIEEFNIYNSASVEQEPQAKFPLGSALTMLYKMRAVGLDCFVKVGVITNDSLKRDSKELHEKKEDFVHEIGQTVNAPVFNNSDIKKFKREKTEGNATTVTLDPSQIYAWVVVNVDGNYLNIDPYYDYLKKTYRHVDVDNCFLVPDNIIAHSRNFSVNEDFFGITPTSNSYNYMLAIEDKSLVLPKDPRRMNEFLKNEIEENIKSKTDKYYRQFTDKETMNLYVREYKKVVDEVNRQNQNPISTYDIYTDPSTLLVCIKNIAYSI